MTNVRWMIVTASSLLFSALVVGTAWIIVRNDLSFSAEEVARIKGESLVHLIQTTRKWNANHGGVYVIQTPETPPNPYLNVPDRDITDSFGRRLTKMNPAYMTRQLSELLNGSDVEARLTSLSPLNPINYADSWESKVLQQFNQGLREGVVSFQENDYRYLAPLVIETGCLQCHQQQGYQLGDVRGGLSVKFPAAQITALVDRLKAHSANMYLGAFAVIFILVMAIFIVFNIYTGRLKKSEELEKQLRYHADHDGLTAVLNHRAINERARYEYKRSVRDGSDLSILMLDLDHFKKINDTYGHQKGDEVLVSIVEHVRLHLREIDYIGRYGGEEFMVILPNVKGVDAAAIAERIRASVQAACLDLGHSDQEQCVSVTLSTGVAERHHEEISGVESLIAIADEALYLAKGQGRNCVVYINAA